MTTRAGFDVRRTRQTASEADASITPTDERYDPGYVERYGGAADGTTDSTAALESANAVGRQAIKFYETGRTDVLNTYTGRHRFYIVRDAYIDRGWIQGPVNMASDGTQVNCMLRLGREPDNQNGGQWRWRKIEGVNFSGKQRVDNAISFGADNNYPENLTTSWEIKNCFFERCNKGIEKPTGNFGQIIRNTGSGSCNYGYWARGYPIRSKLSADEALGQTVLSVEDTNFVSVGDVVRVQMDDGTTHLSTITVVTSTTVTIADPIDDDAATGNWIKFYHPDDGVSVTLSHVGADYIVGGEWAGSYKAAFYIDAQNAQGTGQTVLQNCIIEGNGGFGIFVKDYNNAYTALTLRNCWFESNAKDAPSYAGTVDLDDGFGAREPKDIYLENVDNCYIMGSQIRLVEFIDSSVHLDHCTFESGITEIIVTNTNDLMYLKVTNAHIAAFGEDVNGAADIVFDSLARVDRSVGTSVSRMWRTPTLTPIKANSIARGSILESDRGDRGENWQAVAPAVDVAKDAFVEGHSYSIASQYTFLASSEYLAPAIMAVSTVTVGKWYVATMELRVDSGLANIGALKFGGGFNFTRGDAESLLVEGEWRTIGIVGQFNDSTVSGSVRPWVVVNSGGNVQITWGATQIVEFDNAQDAYEFYNRNVHVYQTKTALLSKIVSTARPSNSTLSDDPELSGWPLEADTNYRVTGYINFDTNATADLKFLFDFSNAAQNISIAAKIICATAGSETFDMQTDTNPVAVDGNAAAQAISFDGIFKSNATTGGDVAFQWAQNTLNAYSTTIEEGSWIKIAKLHDES